VVNKSDDHPDRNGKKRNVLRHCLNIASDGAAVTCDGRSVPEVGAGYWKSPLAESRD